MVTGERSKETQGRDGEYRGEHRWLGSEWFERQKEELKGEYVQVFRVELEAWEEKGD